MALATRHRNDPLPEMQPVPGLVVRQESDATVMAALQSRTVDEMNRRLTGGHRAYVAWRDEQPAAWGWVATQSAHIGELDATFTIPLGERYLWNFVTLPAQRGLGIYPRLLDAIVGAESREAERFWVAYAPENHASGTGIRKAGFVTVAELSFDEDGRPGVSALIVGGGHAAARLLGVPLAEVGLSQCWRCARAGAPVRMSCPPGACRCDYQQPQRGCA
jgi:hypothetical protein